MADRVTCSFCDQLTCGGLRIYGEVLCSSCEERIARLGVEDEDYDRWIACLRTLWAKWLKET